MSSIKYVIKRSGAKVPFKPSRISNAIYRAAVAVGGRDKELADFLSNEVVRILEAQTPAGHIPHIEEIQDLVEKVLIEKGHASVSKVYILYREERARRRRDLSKRAATPSETIPWAKIWHVLDWSVDHNLNTILSMNERIRAGEFPDIVNESEAMYEEDVGMVSEMILERIEELKMVIISGPSSSGKTTTTTKLGERLKKHNLKLVTLNIDNYFHNLDMHPRDEFGDYDFETPQALDLELINSHFQELIEGKEVLMPYYDFKTGTRYLNRTALKLAKDEILLIDSLHGLYPDMTRGVPVERMFKLYLEPLLQMKGPDGEYIRWTDIRLIRRMLRDAVHRAYKPQQTLEHWHYVRSSELRNIIPYINTTDYIINTSMSYEIALYRPLLFNEFNQWRDQYSDNPLREDAMIRARRAFKFLEAVEPVEDDSPVPGASVLREFIGGSEYDQ